MVMPRPIGGRQLVTWREPEDQADRLRQHLGGGYCGGWQERGGGNVRMRPAPRLEDLDRGIELGDDDER
jgi:hypothetical protein